MTANPGVMGHSAQAFWAGRRCAVTGAGGFIGGRLCQRLRSLGAVVSGLGRGPEPPGLTDDWWRCDVSDELLVRRALTGCRPDYVFHLASKVMGARNLSLVMPTLLDNLMGFVHVAMAAGDLKCERIITMGSLQEPDEELLGVSCSPYAAAKFAASSYARMFAGVFSLPVTIARTFMVYGPGQTDFTKVLPYVASRLLNGQAAEMSSGQQPFDWIFVDDVVGGLLALAMAPGMEGRTVDIGTGVLTRTRDVAIGVAKRLSAVDKLRLGVLPDRKLEPTRIADVAATTQMIGWAPAVSLDKGLDLTLAWYRANVPIVGV